MEYIHLTPIERESIMKLSIQGYGVRAIARKMDRSPSTISRELSRNAGTDNSYSAYEATRKYRDRRISCRPKLKLANAETQEYLLADLRDGWSPEQIVGRLELCGKQQPGVSVTTIYRGFKRGLLPKETKDCLRRKGKPYRRKDIVPDRRGRIKNAVSIEDRPKAVEGRKMIGHWEGDTVLGSPGTGGIVTLVERRSRYTLAKKIADKTAGVTTEAIVALFEDVPSSMLKTLTLDNGKEFAGHEEIAALTSASIYFAHPGHPGERGTNENTNGLIREYLPKGLDFREVTDNEVQQAAARLNNRPRKCLGFHTPSEVFFKRYSLLHLA